MSVTVLLPEREKDSGAGREAQMRFSLINPLSFSFEKEEVVCLALPGKQIELSLYEIEDIQN